MRRSFIKQRVNVAKCVTCVKQMFQHLRANLKTVLNERNFLIKLPHLFLICRDRFSSQQHEAGMSNVFSIPHQMSSSVE